MAIKPVPDGYTTVTPWLISRDTPRLIDYVTSAFGATELSRLTGPDGTSVTEVTHLFFGDRVGRVRAPLGNVWWIQSQARSQPRPGS